MEEEESDWVANRAADGGGVGVRSPAGGTQSPVISRTTHGEIATSATSGASDVISTSGDAIWRYEITCAVPVEVPEMAAARRISSRSPWAPSVVSGLDQPTLRTALETADGEGGGGEGGGGGGGGYRPEDDEDEDADEVAALQAALVASAASAANPQVTSPGVALCRARHAHGGSRLRCGSLTIARIHLHPPTGRVPSASGSANELCHAASASQPQAGAPSPVPVLVARAQASWRHRTSSTARSTSTMTSSTGARLFPFSQA